MWVGGGASIPPHASCSIPPPKIKNKNKRTAQPKPQTHTHRRRVEIGGGPEDAAARQRIARFPLLLVAAVAAVAAVVAAPAAAVRPWLLLVVVVVWVGCGGEMGSDDCRNHTTNINTNTNTNTTKNEKAHTYGLIGPHMHSPLVEAPLVLLVAVAVVVAVVALAPLVRGIDRLAAGYCCVISFVLGRVVC